MINLPCSKCEEGTHDKCIAVSLIDNKKNPLCIPGFTLEDAHRHCYCLSQSHKETEHKLAPLRSDIGIAMEKVRESEEKKMNSQPAAGLELLKDGELRELYDYIKEKLNID